MYRTIFTNYGRAAIAAAHANGTAVSLTHMAVGDGNGAAVEPSEEQTALVNEVFRAELSALYQDASDPTKFIAEFVVPASEGGFTARELGLFDEDGELVAVANTPEVYKPTSAEGVFADSAFRMVIRVANADSIALAVDTSLVAATTAYVNSMLGNHYTKSEAEDLLNGELEGYYTSTEVDSALAGKVSKSGDTMTGKLGVVAVDSTVSALGNVSGSKAIDVSSASTFTMTITGNASLTFSGAPGSNRDQVTYLKVTNGGNYTITWPTGTLYAGGDAPMLTQNGTDLVGIWYDVAQTKWVVGVIFEDYQ